jgi:hypothetical protein
MPRPWNKKIPRAQREEEAQRQAEICAQASAAAEELRWNVFVDTMVAVASTLAERAAERRTAAGRIDDTGQTVCGAQELTEKSPIPF